MKATYSIILILLPVFCFSQTAIIENLKKKVAEAPAGESKVKAVFALCEQFTSLNPDTMMAYTKIAGNIAAGSGNKDDQLRTVYYQTICLLNKGNVDSALILCDQSLAKLAGDTKDPILEAEFFNQKGRCFMRNNRYTDAVDMGYKTVSSAEKYNDTLLEVKGKTLIGWAYMEMGQLQDALVWHLKALRTATDTSILNQYPTIYANLCTNYTGLNKIDSAFYYADKAIGISRKYGNLLALSNALAMKSELYEKSGHPNLAGPALEEVVAIRKIIGDPFYIAADLSQLGYFYAHNGQPLKGIDVCNEGIAIAKKYHLDSKLYFLYLNLADSYKAAGNTAKYAEVLGDIITLKDSVYKKNSAEDLAEMGAKYDLQKKENLIIQQNSDLRERNYLFYGSLVVLVFVSLLGWLLFHGYRRRQKIRLLQMQEEEKIRSVVAVTKAEESERKRIAADLHDNLGAYAAAIASNVDRLGMLQGNAPALHELKINSQSIVSQLNDTIWVLKKDNLSLTAISDRVKLFIQQLRPSYPGINIDVIEHISDDTLLPPAQAFNVYQIIKEGISNTVKHSGAKNLRVYFETGAKWKITVSDDGNGIPDSEKNSGKGNGLFNMRNRGREAGLHLSWEENEPHGTNVIITPTTN